jgi:nitrate reductase gamma subunit
MSLIDQFLWIVFPYIALTVFVFGLFVRYNTDQKGWTAKSSQMLERRLLKWGSLPYHIGIIFAFLGHVGGILVPLIFYRTIGMPDEQYHLMAAAAGGLSGVAVCVGILILLYRRFLVRRIRITSSVGDRISIILLAIVIFLGMTATVIHTINPAGFDYRENLAPWFRGILTLRPNAAFMAQVPTIFKIHVLSAFLFVAIMPFTRMVHLLSQPVTYLARSYVVYRKRRS